MAKVSIGRYELYCRLMIFQIRTCAMLFHWADVIPSCELEKGRYQNESCVGEIIIEDIKDFGIITKEDLPAADDTWMELEKRKAVILTLSKVHQTKLRIVEELEEIAMSSTDILFKLDDYDDETLLRLLNELRRDRDKTLKKLDELDATLVEIFVDYLKIIKGID